MRKIIFFSSFVFLLFSCKNETSPVKYDTAILSDYIKSESVQFVLTNQLIACAASTDFADPEQSAFPISVFYYPISGAYDIKYFEINNAGNNQNNYVNYTIKDLQNVPIFNGYLGKFKSNVSQDTWCIIT